MLAQLSFSGLDWLPILLASRGLHRLRHRRLRYGAGRGPGADSLHAVVIIPLLVLLDFVAAFGNLLPSRRDVVRSELLRLLPCMAVGCTLGVVFLLQLKSDLLLLLMGCSSRLRVYGLAVKVGRRICRACGRCRWARQAACSGRCSAVAGFYMRST
jgi:uncharacterized membrane protein YfcA